jgi:hypothetical protein
MPGRGDIAESNAAPDAVKDRAEQPSRVRNFHPRPGERHLVLTGLEG